MVIKLPAYYTASGQAEKLLQKKLKTKADTARHKSQSQKIKTLLTSCRRYKLPDAAAAAAITHTITRLLNTCLHVADSTRILGLNNKSSNDVRMIRHVRRQLLSGGLKLLYLETHQSDRQRDAIYLCLYLSTMSAVV